MDLSETQIELGKLSAGSTAVFLCDLQEKLLPAMLYKLEVVKNAKKLVEATKVLGVPLIVTEQYPKGLGNTTNELDIQHAIGIYPKTKFSMVVPQVESTLKDLYGGHLKCAVLFGVEAHVCVEQTAVDLIQKGIKVHVVADATTSRTQEDRILAFERLRQIGCFVSTTEAVIFKLLGDKEHPKFNEIRPLIKETSAETGLTSKMLSAEHSINLSYQLKLEVVYNVLIKLSTDGKIKHFNKELEKELTILLNNTGKEQLKKRKKPSADVIETKPEAKLSEQPKITDLKCQQCLKQFSRPQELKRHLKIHSHLSCFLCEACGESFRSRDGLAYHTVRIHSADEEPTQCEQCRKIFATEYQLKVHLKNSHQRAKSLLSCPICSKEFHRKDVFQNHLTWHNGEKPFKCLNCDKSFKSKSNLNAHKRIHDSSLSLQCSNCCKKFNSKRKLATHVSQCLNAKLCRSCKFSCQRDEELMEHVKKTHPADYAIQAVFGDSLQDASL